jgi:DNA primase
VSVTGTFRAARIDTTRLRRTHPIVPVVAGRYGIALRPVGRALVGRCPLHADGEHPNLHVYPAADPAGDGWFCYRCGVGGDVIELVERVERLDFRTACARLGGGGPSLRGTPAARLLPVGPAVVAGGGRGGRPPRRLGPAARACLAAAVALYHRRLWREPAALDYVLGRGLEPATLECYRVGYAAGDDLLRGLRRRGLAAGAARAAGLLTRDGRERLAGRIVVPELRGGAPVWLIGRALGAAGGAPRYLGLPGRKPLLGWEAVAPGATALLTEGPFDWLALRQWGYPALCLVGTHASAPALRALQRFARVYLVLDADEAGRAATATLTRALGRRARPVRLPGVKDVAELAERPDGRLWFARSLGTGRSDGGAAGRPPAR